MFNNVTNESGVIVYFAQNCDKHDYNIISIKTGFPDCQIYSRSSGKELSAEFEYKSSSFWNHGHDIRNCDIIICWEHDTEDICLPVIELSTDNWFVGELCTDDEKELCYLRKRVKRLESEIKKLISIKEDRDEDSSSNISKKRLTSLSRDRDLAFVVLECATGRSSYRQAAEKTKYTHTSVANYKRDLSKLYTNDELEIMYLELRNDRALLNSTELLKL